MVSKEILDKVSNINKKLDILYDSTITNDYSPIVEIRNLNQEKNEIMDDLSKEGYSMDYLYSGVYDYKGDNIND